MAGQAAVLTYMDVFRFMGYIGIAALLLLFLFERGRNNAAAAAAVCVFECVRQRQPGFRHS